MEKEKVKKDDFVEIEYTAKVDGIVFDTTNEAAAKANNIFDENASYKPVIICVGQANVIKGIDEGIIGKEVEKTYNLHINPEDGFGKKNPKMLQLISTSKFLKEEIRPMPGLQVNVDGIFGVVKAVSGGRTIVDFNHPLAGKELDYEVNVKRIVIDTKEKLEAIVRLRLGLKEFSADIVDGNAEIIVKEEINEKIRSLFEEEVKKLVPEIKKLDFKQEEKKDKEKTKV